MSVYLTAQANHASEWEEPTTLARGMHVPKCPGSYPSGIDAFVDIYLTSDTWLGEFTLFAHGSLLPHYQPTFIFFNNICNTLTCAYTYDRM